MILLKKCNKWAKIEYTVSGWGEDRTGIRPEAEQYKEKGAAYEKYESTDKAYDRGHLLYHIYGIQYLLFHVFHGQDPQ